ncbi:Asp23/Gls24 family envelope stress response protein [Streptomyces sp. NPDC048201]|uniref:Asp23/Gls24 family envelope stress response protein n=1 Tax=Streptomyces sp. NPDC048201 TaxID=3365513 RepID=UPI0037138DCE
MTTHTDPPDRATGSDGDDERLACGRLLSEVWDAWEQGTPDPHRAACPHCAGAVRELTLLETTVRELREDSVPDDTGYDASALTRRVMDVVRMELRPGRPVPLGDEDEDLWVMEAVAARTLRAAAETVTGVRAGSCRIAPPETSARGEVTVRLEVHAPVGVPLEEVAEEVRRRVAGAARLRLGLRPASVDIRITDLVDVPAGFEEDPTDD